MRKLLATVAGAMVLAVGLWLAVTAGASPAQSTTTKVKTATLIPTQLQDTTGSQQISSTVRSAGQAANSEQGEAESASESEAEAGSEKGAAKEGDTHEDAPDQLSSQRHPSPSSIGGMRVLVVEDDSRMSCLLQVKPFCLPGAGPDPLRPLRAAPLARAAVRPASAAPRRR